MTAEAGKCNGRSGDLKENMGENYVMINGGTGDHHDPVETNNIDLGNGHSSGEVRNGLENCEGEYSVSVVAKVSEVKDVEGGIELVPAVSETLPESEKEVGAVEVEDIDPVVAETCIAGSDSGPEIEVKSTHQPAAENHDNGSENKVNGEGERSVFVAAAVSEEKEEVDVPEKDVDGETELVAESEYEQEVGADEIKGVEPMVAETCIAGLDSKAEIAVVSTHQLRDPVSGSVPVAENNDNGSGYEVCNGLENGEGEHSVLFAPAVSEKKEEADAQEKDAENEVGETELVAETAPGCEQEVGAADIKDVDPVVESTCIAGLDSRAEIEVGSTYQPQDLVSELVPVADYRENGSGIEVCNGLKNGEGEHSVSVADTVSEKIEEAVLEMDMDRETVPEPQDGIADSKDVESTCIAGLDSGAEIEVVLTHQSPNPVSELVPVAENHDNSSGTEVCNGFENGGGEHYVSLVALVSEKKEEADTEPVTAVTKTVLEHEAGAADVEDVEPVAEATCIAEVEATHQPRDNPVSELVSATEWGIYDAEEPKESVSAVAGAEIESKELSGDPTDELVPVAENGNENQTILVYDTKIEMNDKDSEDQDIKATCIAGLDSRDSISKSVPMAENHEKESETVSGSDDVKIDAIVLHSEETEESGLVVVGTEVESKEDLVDELVSIAENKKNDDEKKTMLVSDTGTGIERHNEAFEDQERSNSPDINESGNVSTDAVEIENAIVKTTANGKGEPKNQVAKDDRVEGTEIKEKGFVKEVVTEETNVSQAQPEDTNISRSQPEEANVSRSQPEVEIETNIEVEEHEPFTEKTHSLAEIEFGSFKSGVEFIESPVTLVEKETRESSECQTNSIEDNPCTTAATPGSSDAQAVKSSPVYLIKVPKFIDDDLEMKIQRASMELTEKTRIRDSVQEDIHKHMVKVAHLEQELKDATVKEKTERVVLNSKNKEIANAQILVNRINSATSITELDEKIHHLSHRQQHETIDLKQEKQYIREIKQLKMQLREELSLAKVPHEQIDEALGQRTEVFARLEKLRKELQPLKEVVSLAAKNRKQIWERVNEERDVLTRLKERCNVANTVRQEAFKYWQELKRQSREKFKHFSVYMNDKNTAVSYIFSGDNEGLRSHCDRQVERIMEQWNKSDDFRKEYVKANLNRTIRRLGTADGRSLGPGEKAPIVPLYVDRKLNRPSLPSSRVERPAPLVSTGEALATKKATKAKNSEPVVKDVLPTVSNCPEPRKKSERETKLEELAKKEELARQEEELRKENAAKEEKLKKEKAAEELRLRKEEAEAKEKLVLEQKAKFKQAEERKRRMAEKAEAKANYKKQMEAQLREQKKAMKEKKAASGQEAEATPVANINLSETSSPKEAETTVASTSKLKRRSRPVIAAKQHDLQPMPLPLRNRGKRKMTTWMWVILTTLLVLLLFIAGNYISIPAFSSSESSD